MKKIFLTAITAMALCSYSYAQDDEYEEEYEEDEAPARVEEAAPASEEEEAEEAPAAKPQKKTAAKAATGASMGIGMGLSTDFDQLNFKYKLNQSMMVTAILGLYHHGETSVEAAGMTVDAGDNYTSFAIGAGFDYFFATPYLPTSAGIELVYASNGETETADGMGNKTTHSSGDLLINLMFGAHAEIIPNFVLSGKVGLGFDYIFSSDETSNAMASVTTDVSRLDFGLKAGVYATWFFM